jgi:hypothetical protein
LRIQGIENQKCSQEKGFIIQIDTKAKSNYRGYDQNPATQKFYIHFFIDNFNVNISLHTLSCPKLKFGQLKKHTK